MERMMRFIAVLCTLLVVSNNGCSAQTNNNCPTAVPLSHSEWFRCAWSGDPHFHTWCGQHVDPQGLFNGWNYDNSFISSKRNLTHGGSTYTAINSTYFRINAIVSRWSDHFTVTRALEFVFISDKRYYAITRVPGDLRWRMETVRYETDEFGTHGIPTGRVTSQTFPIDSDRVLRSHADDGNFRIAKLYGVSPLTVATDFNRVFSFEFYTGLGCNGWSLTDAEYECKKRLSHIVTWSGGHAIEVNINRNAAHFFNDDPTRDMRREMPTVGWCGNPLRQNPRYTTTANCTFNYQFILDVNSDRYINRFKSKNCRNTADPAQKVCNSPPPTGVTMFNDWEHSFEVVPPDVLDRHKLFMTISAEFTDHARLTFSDPHKESTTGRNVILRRLLSDDDENASIGVFSDPARFEEASRICNLSIAAKEAIRVAQGFAPSTEDIVNSSRNNCIIDFSSCPQDKPLTACKEVALSNTEALALADVGTQIVNETNAKIWAKSNGISTNDDQADNSFSMGAMIAIGAVGSVIFVGFAAVGIKRVLRKSRKQTSNQNYKV